MVYRPVCRFLELSDLKKDEFKEFLRQSKARDFSDLNTRRVRAVEYADKYCGAAALPGIMHIIKNTKL